jgi:hypothetical protein
MWIDNCHSDDAVTNARQLADLLSSTDVPVATPGGERTALRGRRDVNG